MDEDQEYFSALNYEDEMQERQMEIIQGMVNDGVSPEVIPDVYEAAAVNVTPTFSTSPENNPLLNKMLLVAEGVKNPSLREENEEVGNAYNDYIEYIRQSEFEQGSAVVKGLSAIKRAVVGTGIFQTGGRERGEMFNEIDPDSSKAMAWVDTMIGTLDEGTARKKKGLEQTAFWTGIVADTVVLQTLIGGDLKTVSTAMKAKNAVEADSVIFKAVTNKIINNSISTGKKITKGTTLFAKVAAQGAEDLAMGTAFALGDIYKNPDFNNQSTKDKISETVSAFGVGVGVDLIMNTAMNIAIPGMRTYGKLFFSPVTNKLTKKGVITSVDEAIDAALDVVTLRTSDETIKTMRRNGSGEVADIIERSKNQMQEIKVLQETGNKVDAGLKTLAAHKGMDITPIEGGYEVIVDTMAKKAKKIQVTSAQEAVDLIDKKVIEGLKRPIKKIDKTAEYAKDFKVTQKFQSTINSKNAKFELSEFADSIVPPTGAFTASSKANALHFVENAINSLGTGAKNADEVLDAKLATSFFKEIPNPRSSTLLLPKKISNFKELKQYTKYIGDFISHHGDDIDGGVLSETLEILGDMDGAWTVTDPHWIKRQAANLSIELKKADGKYIAIDGDSIIPFESEELLGNYIFSKSITDESYQEFLTATGKFKLDIDEELGTYAVKNAFGSTEAVGESVEQLMAENPFLRPKYPLRTAPSMAYVDSAGEMIEHVGDHIVGSPSQIAKYFSNYDQNKAVADIRKGLGNSNIKKTYGNGTKVSVNRKKTSWVIESPSSGLKPYTVHSEKKLLEYMERVSTNELQMLEAGFQKGVEVVASKAGYIIQKAGEADIVLNTFDDVVRKLKNMPNQPLTPEIFAAEERMIKESTDAFDGVFNNIDRNNHSIDQNVALMKETYSAANEAYFSKTKGDIARAASNVAHTFRDSRGVIDSLVKGRPEIVPMKGLYHNLIETSKTIATMQSDMHTTLKSLDKLVPKTIGKGKDVVNHRANLGKVLSKEFDEKLWPETFKKLTGKDLNSNDIKFMQGIRDLFDKTGELNGFGNSLDTIRNYFPSMRTLTPEDFMNDKTSAVQLAEKAFGRKLFPAEEKFFNRMRTSDLSAYAYQDDPIALYRRYFDDTLKSTMLEPSVDNLVNFAKENMTEPKEVQKIIDIGRQARSLTEDNTLEALKNLNDKIGVAYNRKVADGFAKAQTAGKTTNTFGAFFKGEVTELSQEVIDSMSDIQREQFNKAMSKHQFRSNPMNNVFGAVTLGTQAGKLALPIRNTFQPETHIAPIFGFDAVIKAKKAFSEMTPEGMAYLKHAGILQPKTVQEMSGITGSGMLNSANDLLLTHFKLSDDQNRAIGWLVARDAIADGLEISQNWGAQGADYFSQATKLYTAEPEVQTAVLEAIAKHDFEGATNTYAQWINSMTNLDYTPIAKPKAFSSAYGKAFGQMGTFATQTLSSRKYFMERMTKSDKALYIGRLVLGGLALNSAWTEATGSDVTSFSSYKSMLFGGGPAFQSANNVLALTSDYSRAEGLAALKRSMKSTFTPWKTASNIGTGIYDMTQGDTHAGFMKVLNAPGSSNPNQKSIDSAWDFMKARL